MEKKDDLASLQIFLTSEKKQNWETCVHKQTGDSALHIAVKHSSIKLLKFLLNSGCNTCLKMQNIEGKTPLHEACVFSNIDAVSLLIESGANVNALKRGDWTPLMIAITKNNAIIVNILLSEGASLTCYNKDGWTPFHLSCREGNMVIINTILEKQNLLWNTQSFSERTPLHTACFHGKLNVVQRLLNCKNLAELFLEKEDACGYTPLLDAVRNDHLHIVNYLRSNYNADVNHTDRMGKLCIHIAAEAGHCDTVTDLINRHEMNVNALTPLDQTPLHFAAREGHMKMLSLLLSLGCLLNAVDRKGRTAVWWAAAAQQKSTVAFLENYGALRTEDNFHVFPTI